MTPPYVYRHELFDKRYSTLYADVQDQIRLAAAALLQVVNMPSFQLDLGLNSLLVGDYEPALQRHPLLYSILIRDGSVLVQVELVEDYQPFDHFDSFDLADFLSLLAVIESQLDEFS
jgi:hypothetical protein